MVAQLEERLADPSVPHAFVGDCLLTLEPFQGCGPLEIRDTRPPRRQRIYPCPQRLRLVNMLVYALITYDEDYANEQRQAWRPYRDAWADVVALRHAVQVYTRRKRKRAFPPGAPSPRHMAEALQCLTAGVQCLTPEDDRPSRGPRVPLAKVLLYTLMAQAFLHHRPPGYPHAAMWDAIARIACHFGVEDEPELRPLVPGDQADTRDYARVAHRIDRHIRRLMDS
jgi:hypothetical protein